MNDLSFLALLMLNGFTDIFNKITPEDAPKFADATKLKVCEIKREFSHKTMKNKASKSKSTMGWLYGMKLHIICNELMQILGFTITTATVDD